jgi:GPN-loop GTPase
VGNAQAWVLRYNLGPNGGILTALNLFTTKFDQVLGLVEKRAEEVEYVRFRVTPTEHELNCGFWAVILFSIRQGRLKYSPGPRLALSLQMPLHPRFPPLWHTLWTLLGRPLRQLSCPTCFMHAGMPFFSPCQCCTLTPASILYKTKLPFIVVFNKTDVNPHGFALEWMQDFEAFQAALASHQGTTDSEGEPTYMNSLMNSMSLVLDEFYKHLKVLTRYYSFVPND